MTRKDAREGGAPEPGRHANREREVTEASAPTSSSETETSGRTPADSGMPGKRRLHKVAGSARSVEAGAYQGAMEATFAIVIAALLGYWADEHFGTTPRWLIVGVVIGFATFVLRLMRMAKLVQDPHSELDSDEGPREQDAD